MGPVGVRVRAMRPPSGEISTHQSFTLGSRAKRASSGPRPLMGSSAARINCLLSSVGSAITQFAEGDDGQLNELHVGAINNSCDGPPSTGTRMTGSGWFGHPPSL